MYNLKVVNSSKLSPMKCFLILICLALPEMKSYCQSCTYPPIDSNAIVSYTCRGNLQINGKVDDTSQVKLTSMDGNVSVNGKIDMGSNVEITATHGSVTISSNIDRGAIVKIVCRGDIVVEGKVDGGAHCDFYSERGKVIIKDKVANTTTAIRYHSVYPPDWGQSIAIVPTAY